MGIGRNAPCPCGSGKKFKKCHGAIGADAVSVSERDLERAQLEIEAHKRQREAQQGLGRPIISTIVSGYRFVAVGNSLHWSKKWKTFHDFLLDYIRELLGGEWDNEELKKPLDARHPILQWYHSVCMYQRETIKQPGRIVSAVMTGAVAAYLGLAYNLYLLAHNVEVQKRLLTRLKNRDSFHGAYYETFVAASFIKAGFDLELEDETDGATTHCEFTATYRTSGRKYSVEAKARHIEGVLGTRPGAGARDKERIKVGHQLHKALRKEANHTRVVFIDVNVPDKVSGGEEVEWLRAALNVMREKEASMTVDGAPAPPAYVFLTNHPYHHEPESKDFRVAVVAEGFKIPDFKLDARFANIREALASRETHSDMFQLMLFLRDLATPATFDGELPEFAFGQVTEPRLKIGCKYLIPDADGQEVVGELQDAIVMEREKLVWGVYRLENGRSIIANCPISDAELAVFQRHRDTFFGVYKRHSPKIKDPLELFDVFFAAYKTTPKERLLEFMKDAPNIGEMKEVSQEELAFTYCEGLVYAVMRGSEAMPEYDGPDQGALP